MRFFLCFFISLSVCSAHALKLTPALKDLLYSKKNKAGTEAFIIQYKGKVIHESYGNGFTRANKHVAWSISKSVTSLILGGLAQKNMISADQSICSLMPTVRDARLCPLKINDFMNWASGFQWNEIPEKGDDLTQLSVGQMLYGDGALDTLQFVLSQKRIAEPGEKFEYSTGDSTVLLALARHAVPVAEEQTFPWKYLFEPLGIDDVTFEQDQAGNFIGGSGLVIRPIDLLKIGQLVMNRGQWNGQQIVSPEWIDYLMKPNDAFHRAPRRNYYPLHSWWTPKKEFHLPADTVMALGHWGQALTVIPSMDLIVVRMGYNPKDGFEKQYLPALQQTIALVKEQGGAQ